MLDPVRGMAKRWQVVMDSPIARGAEPCGKYLMEMLKKFLRFLDTGLKKDPAANI
jgi:hypothetical protein